MSEENSIESQTAAKVAERRKRGPNKAKPETKPEAAVQAPTPQAPAVALPPLSATMASPVEAQPAAPVAIAKSNKLFPVTMVRNYHPIHDFLVNGLEPTAEQRVKVPAGASIDMDLNEARDIIARGIAVRNDPIG